MSHFFKPLVKSSHIREILVQEIGARYKVGDKLPTELELAEQYRVSRETIRMALGHLENDGLIERKRGRGTFVRQLPGADGKRRLTGSIADPPDLTTASLITKGFISAPVEAAWLKKSNDQVWQVRRLRLYEDAPLVVHDAYVADFLIAAAEAVDMTASSMRNELEMLLSQRFWETECQIDAVAADSVIGPLLEIPIGMPVLQLKRFYMMRGNPAIIFYSYYRTDRYYYTVKSESNLPEEAESQDPFEWQRFMTGKLGSTKT